MAETFGIGLLGPFFGIVSDPTLIQRTPALQHASQILGTNSNESFIVFLCGLIVFVFLIKSALYFFSKYYILHFSHSHRGKMIEILNKAYLNSDYNYFIGKNSANLLKNITVETQDFCYKILLSLLYGVSNLLILFFLLLLMMTTDMLLLLVTLAALAPIFLIIYAMRNHLRRWGKTVSEAMQDIIKTLNHGLGGFKETRVIGCAPYFEAQMAEYTQRYAHTASLSASFNMLPRILIETALVVFIVLFIAVSQLFLTRSTDELIASLSVFAVASIRLLPAASQVMGTLGGIQSTRHVADILYADLKEAENQIAQYNYTQKSPGYGLNGDSSNAMKFAKQISLRNILYRYSEKLEPAINNISLEIKKGESIAFIGKSGAGKTTLVDIILGVLMPQEGDITVDGASIYENLRAWQNLVGYIPQSIFLLDDTVERNIAFGVPDRLIDYERLEKAIASAQLEELVQQLPKGIHTRVGERGVMLSGGQRQRIGIARALYHEREILVLDEATSALDNETEQKVSEAIQTLSGEKTVIIIAHRLSTVKHCNRVYSLEKGVIARAGTYQEVVLNQ
ncbi:ABC transporter ATP-binding protein [Nodosilinea sp. PGN35]|uniref:ABC transporter ATP-binding protein n=1 Tax=Nodosilinea sp. PGN35 TaxID=3020489 RepID=UPI0023B303DD|nr:ABC transporter ATP-binding protein [Nodosilinea sp. TSF1-S3]MDF0367310.1 ABC transporter ATP-binding protein [Nodosilinea sp. TSF1-S3]